MRTQDVTFHSDGLALGGSWFLPDDLDEAAEHPVVIPCSGFTGLKDAHPARFARFLTARGHLCFGFDYRGFAGSEGLPRRVVLDEQVRDILHAVAFVENDPRADPDRIVLLGWGMAAGLVLDAAREQSGVVGVIAANGFYRGRRVQEAHRTPGGYQAFRERVREDRRRRAATGSATTDDAFAFYPLDEDSRAYVDSVLREIAGYETDAYADDLGEALLRFDPEAYAPRMTTPLLIAHGTENRLHPPEEAESLYRAYAGPKELFWLDGAGHTEFMLDDDSRFRALGAEVARWIEDLLERRGRSEGQS